MVETTECEYTCSQTATHKRRDHCHWAKKRDRENGSAAISEGSGDGYKVVGREDDDSNGGRQSQQPDMKLFAQYFCGVDHDKNSLQSVSITLLTKVRDPSIIWWTAGNLNMIT